MDWHVLGFPHHRDISIWRKESSDMQNPQVRYVFTQELFTCVDKHKHESGGVEYIYSII